jgi:hypothetical protein
VLKNLTGAPAKPFLRFLPAIAGRPPVFRSPLNAARYTREQAVRLLFTPKPADDVIRFKRQLPLCLINRALSRKDAVAFSCDCGPSPLFSVAKQVHSFTSSQLECGGDDHDC